VFASTSENSGVKCKSQTGVLGYRRSLPTQKVIDALVPSVPS
jgi:hypothetical protein